MSLGHGPSLFPDFRVANTVQMHCGIDLVHSEANISHCIALLGGKILNLAPNPSVMGY